MAYWLLKSDPETYGWPDLVKDKKTTWDGVRNPQASKFLQAMRVGDVAFVYHTGLERRIVGLARVVKATEVAIEAWKPLAVPVTLHDIRLRKTLAKIPLLRQPRLSVMPLTLGQATALLKMGKTPLSK